MRELLLNVKYEGGTADHGYLEVHDALASLDGLSRALTITTLAYLYPDDPKRWAEEDPKVSIAVYTARRGSFEQLVKIAIENPTLVNIGVNLATSAFYDVLKFTWSTTADLFAHPETDRVKELMTRNDPFIDEAVTALAPPIQSIHSPIASDSTITIRVQGDPQVPTFGNDLLIFDKKTLKSVTTRARSEIVRGVSGHVLQYSLVNGFGRIQERKSGKIVRFQKGPGQGSRDTALLTWSMHERGQGRDGEITFDALQVPNARGELMHYRLLRVRRTKPR